jgi:hypothetical protein
LFSSFLLGWEHCANGEDESLDLCNKASGRIVPTSNKKTFIIVIIVVIVMIFFVVYIFQIYRTKNATKINDPKDDNVTAPLSPCNANKAKLTSLADAMRMSTLNSRISGSNSYDRNHITGNLKKIDIIHLIEEHLAVILCSSSVQFVQYIRQIKLFISLDITIS